MKSLGKVHLERALSKLGVASRSQTKLLLGQGRISVNGRVVRDPDFLLVPEESHICVDGKEISKVFQVTVMLNKPKGYVTTRADEKGRQTVYDLLPEDLRHLHPVGRLDMATTGLLLMTTDTQLSNFLTDPRNAIVREYVVTTEGRLTEEQAALLMQGIEDQGEILKAVEVKLRKISDKESHLMVKLNEGKNREIRRMFKALGHEVTALKRIAFGKLKLGELPIGQIVHVPGVGRILEG